MGDQSDELGWGLEFLEGVDAFGNVTDVDVLAESARELGLSEQQIDALADGSVTFAEHERLVRLGLDCMKSSGLVVRELGLQRSGAGVDQVRYAFSEGPSGLTAEEALQSAAYCEQLHFVPATLIYEAEFGLSVEEQQDIIDEAFVRFGRCLETAGITDLPDLDNYDPLMQDALIPLADDPRHDCKIEVLADP